MTTTLLSTIFLIIICLIVATMCILSYWLGRIAELRSTFKYKDKKGDQK